MSLRPSPRCANAYFRLPADIVTERVARYPDDKKVVRTFIEDQFDWHPRISATEHGRIGVLRKRPCIRPGQTEILLADRDDAARCIGPGFDL